MGRKKKIPKFAEAYPQEHINKDHVNDVIRTLFNYFQVDPRYAGTTRHLSRVILAYESETRAVEMAEAQSRKFIQ